MSNWQKRAIERVENFGERIGTAVDAAYDRDPEEYFRRLTSGCGLAAAGVAATAELAARKVSGRSANAPGKIAGFLLHGTAVAGAAVTVYFIEQHGQIVGEYGPNRPKASSLQPPETASIRALHSPW